MPLGVVEVFGSLPCVRYLEPSSPASVVAAVDRLQACIDAHGPFDGVIGFSEGASLAASLIAREAADPSSTRLQPAFACALFLSGGVPFDYGAAVEGKARHLSTEADGEPVAVPSVNVWGRNDTEHPDTSTVLARLCQREGRVEVVHNGRHELPASRDPEFAAMVRAFQDVMERTGVAIPYA